MKTVIKFLTIVIVSVCLPMTLSAQWDVDPGISITTTDNVGIGTTTPTQALDVNGNIKLPDANFTQGSLYFGGLTDDEEIGMRLFGGNVNNLYPGGFIDVVTDNANEGLRFRIDQNNGSAERMRITANGRVGIGITSPAQRLHVKGKIRASSLFLSEYVEIYHGGSNGVINTAGDGNLDFRHDNATKMSLTDTGNLGIGTANPPVKLTVASDSLNPINEMLALFYNSENRRFFFVPEVSSYGYNPMSQEGDAAICWSDALESGAKNSNSALVIAPHGFDAAGIRLQADGKVQIGSISTPGDYKLYVDDGILTEKVKVATVNSADWADYVFEEDYDLNSTEEVETFIEMDATLLRQIEELWLHMIELKKEINTLKKENELLKSDDFYKK